MKTLTIGNLKIKNPLFLAPMVDVSDLAFRLVCRKQGAAIAYTEMLQVEGLLRGGKSMELKTLTNKEDNPLGIQITGRRISDFEKFVPQLEKYKLVDLNCGCPGHLTVDHESGSYLMKNPDKIANIIKTLKKSGTNVTAKIRLGFSKNNVMTLAKKIEKAGADALTLHARLATQKRADNADWSWFSKVKKEIGIPFIGNGDINSPQKVEEALEICDGVMIARAAIGNPAIFKDSLHYLKQAKSKKPIFKSRLKLYSEYLDLAEKYNLLRMSKIKYIGANFLKGFEGAPQSRAEFMKIKSFDGVREFVKKML